MRLLGQPELVAAYSLRREHDAAHLPAFTGFFAIAPDA